MGFPSLLLEAEPLERGCEPDGATAVGTAERGGLAGFGETELPHRRQELVDARGDGAT